jgi:hypothetical protein
LETKFHGIENVLALGGPGFELCPAIVEKIRNLETILVPTYLLGWKSRILGN